MKNKIQTIEDAFVFQLQQLIYTESKIKEGLFQIPGTTSPRLKDEIREYGESSYSKLLKLERIFNYLMREPNGRKNLLVSQILQETTEALDLTSASPIKDIIIVNAFKSINACKVSCYKSAYIYSVELELDTPSDLLQQILEWEVNSGKALARIAIEEFNNLQLPEMKGAG
jgi:ferritin-like metal-binding protein YciE